MKKRKMPKGDFEEGKCSGCGKDIIANMPWIDGDLCGYRSEDHGCGFKKTLVVFLAPNFFKKEEE